MTNVIPVTEARKKLLSLVDEISDSYSRVDLTKKGRVKATLVSPDYLDALEETIYTLENSMSDIKKAEREIAKGNVITLEEFKKDLTLRQKRQNVR